MRLLLSACDKLGRARCFDESYCCVARRPCQFVRTCFFNVSPNVNYFEACLFGPARERKRRRMRTLNHSGRTSARKHVEFAKFLEARSSFIIRITKKEARTRAYRSCQGLTSYLMISKRLRDSARYPSKSYATLRTRRKQSRARVRSRTRRKLPTANIFPECSRPCSHQSGDYTSSQTHLLLIQPGNCSIIKKHGQLGISRRRILAQYSRE